MAVEQHLDDVLEDGRRRGNFTLPTYVDDPAYPRAPSATGDISWGPVTRAMATSRAFTNGSGSTSRPSYLLDYTTIKRSLLLPSVGVGSQVYVERLIVIAPPEDEFNVHVATVAVIKT